MICRVGIQIPKDSPQEKKDMQHTEIFVETEIIEPLKYNEKIT